jgi:prephenate dehydrogenase
MDKTVLTIVGLGQIGASIGLALEPRREQLQRIGHTRNYGEGNHAKELGAVDKVVVNLPSAVEKADIVLLALPVNELEAVLKLIGHELKEGAVVLDTSPARHGAMAWAEELLSHDNYYVGFTPVLGPGALKNLEGGLEHASADLFHGGMFAISSQMGVSSAALKVAADLATMVGAAPLFADAAEVDSYMSRTHLLPQVLAACLVNVAQGSPGWNENRKLAGRSYAVISSLVSGVDNSAAVALASSLNKESMLRLLDELLEELESMRADLAEDHDTDFAKRVQEADERHKEWWNERRVAKWLTDQIADVDIREAGNPNLQLFGFGRPARKKRDQ